METAPVIHRGRATVFVMKRRRSAFRNRRLVSGGMKYALAAFVMLSLTACQYIPGQPEHEIAQAQKHVAADLADPDTVKFRSVMKLRTVLNGADNYSICGELNAKNGFDAYTGFKRFVHNKGRSLIDPQIDRTAELAYANRCLEAQMLDRYDGDGLGFRTRVACRGMEEAEAKLELQNAFEQIWANNCGGYLKSEAFDVRPVYSSRVIAEPLE